MLHNYITIAFRSIKNHKFFFFINVFGLATGIAFCMLIFLFVKDEQSFDRFHTKADRIFRLHQINLHEQAKQERKGLTSKLSGRFSSKMIYLPLPLGPALKKDLPEIESFVKFKGETTVIRGGKEAFKETIHFTDANFFEVFSFDLLQGKEETVLKDLSSVLITEDIARKMFGNQNPIGQTLYITLQGKEK